MLNCLIDNLKKVFPNLQVEERDVFVIFRSREGAIPVDFPCAWLLSANIEVTTQRVMQVLCQSLEDENILKKEYVLEHVCIEPVIKGLDVMSGIIAFETVGTILFKVMWPLECALNPSESFDEVGIPVTPWFLEWIGISKEEIIAAAKRNTTIEITKYDDGLYLVTSTNSFWGVSALGVFEEWKDKMPQKNFFIIPVDPNRIEIYLLTDKEAHEHINCAATWIRFYIDNFIADFEEEYEGDDCFCDSFFFYNGNEVVEF